MIKAVKRVVAAPRNVSNVLTASMIMVMRVRHVMPAVTLVLVPAPRTAMETAQMAISTIAIHA